MSDPYLMTNERIAEVMALCHSTRTGLPYVDELLEEARRAMGLLRAENRQRFENPLHWKVAMREAYGLLWRMKVDKTTMDGRFKSQARKVLFQQLSKEDRAKGIEVAMAFAKEQTSGGQYTKHCGKCGLGFAKYIACEEPDCGPLVPSNAALTGVEGRSPEASG